MILLIDNYDSFTYNLLHYVLELGKAVDVIRNDQVTVDAIMARTDIKGIILSPGPCTPDEAGICLELITACAGKKPLMGVCLGHQAIAQAFGGKVVLAPEPVHGKVAQIFHQGKGIFHDIPNPFQATRYHSLAVEKASLPACLEVTAETKDGIIMGLQHRIYPVFGVQFHPESIASEHGHTLLGHFLECC